MKARLNLACHKGPPKTLKIAIKGPKMTNLRRNKAGYPGQEPYLRLLDHLGRSNEAKDRKKPEKVKCDRQTDGRMDGRTDGPTKRGEESRSTRLKKLCPTIEYISYS